MEKNRELKLVFPDFDINELFANLIIIDANLYKRTNKLEMFIGSNYVLDIIDLAKFRNFLINKFKFTDVEFKINYDESLNELLKESINLQWNNIVKYMNVFNPMIGAFLAGSNADIDADKLIINNICSEFANMIKNQNLDKYIHEFIYNHLKNHSETYTEKELNEKIKELYDDFATMRRYLVDYKFVIRDDYGKSYQLNPEIELEN